MLGISAETSDPIIGAARTARDAGRADLGCHRTGRRVQRVRPLGMPSAANVLPGARAELVLRALNGRKHQHQGEVEYRWAHYDPAQTHVRRCPVHRRPPSRLNPHVGVEGGPVLERRQDRPCGVDDANGGSHGEGQVAGLTRELRATAGPRSVHQASEAIERCARRGRTDVLDSSVGPSDTFATTRSAPSAGRRRPCALQGR